MYHTQSTLRLCKFVVKTQCLKITEKVSFKIANVLSGQKFIKNANNGQFGEFLKIRRLWSNTVTRQNKFKRTIIGEKWDILSNFPTMWHSTFDLSSLRGRGDQNQSFNHLALKLWLCIAQCLKITEKVSLKNIASEASYIYILRGQKFIK